MKQFTITLLRHGETCATKSLNGVTDVALSIHGMQQMRDAATTLQRSTENTIERIISSPMQRCAIIAQEIAQKWSIPFSIDNQIQEMNFGDWDGVPFEILYQQYPDEMAVFFNAPCQAVIPNGEQVKDFYHRIENQWQYYINQHQNILLVCHAGVIRYLIANILGMDLTANKHLSAIKIDYAAIVQIQIFIDDDNQVWPTILWPSTN